MGGLRITVLYAQLFCKPEMALKIKSSFFFYPGYILLFLKNYLEFILGVLLETNTTMTKDSFISLKILTSFILLPYNYKELCNVVGSG